MELKPVVVLFIASGQLRFLVDKRLEDLIKCQYHCQDDVVFQVAVRLLVAIIMTAF